MPAGKLTMLYSDYRKTSSIGFKYNTFTMLGSRSVIGRGMVVYEDEDKVTKAKKVKNNSKIIGCCIIKESEPFDPYHLPHKFP